MIWAGVLVAGGLAALFVGGGFLIAGSVALAQRMGVPVLIIGLTLVGFGTSTPELLVSLDAALRGAPDIALGNVVGSNTANILLILGLAALVAPIGLRGASYGRDLAAMLAAAALLWPLLLGGGLGRAEGAVLLAGLAAYLVLSVRAARAAAPPAIPEVPALTTAGASLRVLAGLGLLMLGARLLVDGAVELARGLGLSEAFIGLTVVAVGTSLPELATSVMAAARRQAEIALGNIIGSNIFNVFGILGATALVAPVPAAPRFLSFDVPLMIAVSLGLAALILLAPRIGRAAGAAMLAGYAAYVALGLG